jgi:cytochrome c2
LADFKDERAYDSKTLTQWFLWSSLALLVCVLLMAYFDYHRSWKEYQRQFMAMERARTKEKLLDVKSSFDFNQYKQLRADLNEADQELKSHQSTISELETKGAKLDAQIYKTKVIIYQPLKAQIDADKYTYSEGVENGNNNKSLHKTIDNEVDRANALTQQLFVLNQQKDQVTQQLAEITAQRDDTQAKITKLRHDFDLLDKKYHSLSFNLLFDFRNAMLLDFMSPTIQIQQVVLKNLPEDLYFAKTMNVDRCMTCHQAIDKKGYEDAPEPFRTHPHLDLFLGATSPHPMDKVGCTVCHGGMGQALSFNTCAHVPNDEEEAKKWKRLYGWKQPEAVQSIMLPLKYTEGSCLKCHGTQELVNFAPHLNRGRELMVTRGCIGCHKVKNLENLTKAGPALLKVKGKLKKDFVLKWVWSPKSFNPAARMPSFFQQSNNSDDNSLGKNKAELNAVVDYLYDKSEDYTPNLAPGAGSVAAGKKLFKEVGCLACHGIDDVTSHHADFAPDLSGTGSKLSAAFVYSWIKNPQHFNPDTRMPSLRLSDREASDITAYLMSKKNKDFEQMSPPDSDPAVRDGLIVDYLTPQLGQDGAMAKVVTMDDKAKTLFLGEKTLNKYGCFGCHMIQGFETAQGIGTELSTWGSKRVSQIDFGFTEPSEIPHTHEGFLNAKLEDPRQFDKDKVVAFQDKLKMPNFYLSPDDRDAIITAVLGLTTTTIPDEWTAGIHGNGPLLEKGRRIVANFNCRGCHLIEDQGGKIREMYEKEGLDLSLAPPNLHQEGAKVQIDWLHNFLTGVHPIRPWLHIRMPSFPWTDEEVSNVISYFNYDVLVFDKLDTPQKPVETKAPEPKNGATPEPTKTEEDQVFPFKTISTAKLSGQDLEETKAMFAKLQCQKCHILGDKIPADLSSAAPDLLNVHKRLKPEWVVEWLKNPDALMPGTRMPGFWPQPEDQSPVPMYFHGDSLKQREALRDYLFMIGKGE